MRERAEYFATVFGVSTDALCDDDGRRCDDVYVRIADTDKKGCVSVGGLAYDKNNDWSCLSVVMT